MMVSCSAPATPRAPTPPLPTIQTVPAKRGPVLTAESVAAALLAGGFPVSEVRVHTAETDPDRLLGRSNQYVGRVSWRDARVGDDATIELFPNLSSLQARKIRVESTNTRNGLTAQYIYVRSDERALLRIPTALTPEQAGEYEDWFGAL